MGHTDDTRGSFPTLSAEEERIASLDEVFMNMLKERDEVLWENVKRFPAIRKAYVRECTFYYAKTLSRVANAVSIRQAKEDLQENPPDLDNIFH